MSNALDALNSQIFAGQLHTKFNVIVAGQAPLELALIEVKEHETAPKFELFTLAFQGPHAPRLNQQIHHFEHEKLGPFDLFVTAIGADEHGLVYEAVFHRRKQPS